MTARCFRRRHGGGGEERAANAGPGAGSKSAIVVLRNVIQITDKGDFERYATCFEKAMASLDLEKALKEAPGDETLLAELEWLARSSWGAGLDAAGAGRWVECAKILRACTSFFTALVAEGSMGDPGELTNLQYKRITSVLAAAANLEIVKREPEREGNIKCAKVLLSVAEQVIRELEAGARTAEQSAVDEKISFVVKLIDFDIATKTQNGPRLVEILHQLKGDPGCTAKHFLQMAEMCRVGKYAHAEAAIVAYHAGLQLLLAEAPPDYALVAPVLRHLILQSERRKGGPTDTLALYQEAEQILVGLRSGEYPATELQWLAATAWNKGTLHRKMRRLRDAERWMRVAMKLADHLEPLRAQFKEQMEAAMEGLTTCLREEAVEE